MKVFVTVNVLKPPLTGIGRYTLQLLEQLLNHPEIEDIKGFGDQGFLDRIAIAELVSRLNSQESPSAAQVRGGKLRRWLGHRSFLRRLYRLQLQHRLKTHLSTLKGYVYWEPGYFLLPFQGPCISTLYDLSHIRHPEMHPRARIVEMRRLLPQTLAQATRLITISNFTRQELIDELEPKQPIDLVSPGVADTFITIDAVQRQACRDAYALPERYILSVATLEPRKNLSGLLKAYAQLPEAMRQTYPLVLAGAPGWHGEELNALIIHLREAGELLYLGYVDQAYIPSLYANASLMVYPSFYEGYGMPIAEAMATGCPVITSNCSSMPEVAGNAAILIDPYDIQSITLAIAEVLTNTSRQNLMRKLGLQRAEEMSWKQRCEALVKSLKAAQTDYEYVIY